MTTVTPGATLAELEADPHPVYARLRREAPVCWIPELRQWLVTTWADVSRVLNHPDMFTNDIPGSPMIPDYHPHRVIDHVDAIVRPWAQLLADGLAGAGAAELVGSYFEPVALLANAELMGLEVTIADVPRLRRWGMAGPTPLSDMDSALAPVVARLWDRPDVDVLPVLKQFAQGQLQAGWLGAWTLSALLERPDQLDEVRADRWLVGAAVYEALRWNSVVGTVTRRGTRVTCLSGRELPEGATLAICLASANRDSSVFNDPNTFDVHRTVRTHLAFGAGTHHCPAFAFVPAIARTALDVLLDRLPTLTPAPGWHPTPHGWKLRLPGPVTVVW